MSAVELICDSTKCKAQKTGPTLKQRKWAQHEWSDFDRKAVRRAHSEKLLMLTKHNSVVAIYWKALWANNFFLCSFLSISLSSSWMRERRKTLPFKMLTVSTHYELHIHNKFTINHKSKWSTFTPKKKSRIRSEGWLTMPHNCLFAAHPLNSTRLWISLRYLSRPEITTSSENLWQINK